MNLLLLLILACISEALSPDGTWTCSQANTPSRIPPDCSPGGKCDCSRIVDKNSEEYVSPQYRSLLLNTRRYFQCITNPYCERCWLPKTTMTTTTFRQVANVTSPFMDYRTMAPGTYTITSNGTVLNIVVTQQVVAPASSTRAFVTLTKTVAVTVAPAPHTVIPSQVSAAADTDCKTCSCLTVGDQLSREYAYMP